MAVGPPILRDLDWSPAEKKVARRAFAAAVAREASAIRQEVEAMLARTGEASEIWRVHDFLSEKRHAFEVKYDYRYSVLILVFGRLLSEEWVTEADLAGLGADKVERIRKVAAGPRGPGA